MNSLQLPKYSYKQKVLIVPFENYPGRVTAIMYNGEMTYKVEYAAKLEVKHAWFYEDELVAQRDNTTAVS